MRNDQKIYYVYKDGEYITRGTSLELSLVFDVSRDAIYTSRSHKRPCASGYLFLLASDVAEKSAESAKLAEIRKALKGATLADAVRIARQKGMTYAQMQVKETCEGLEKIVCPDGYTSYKEREAMKSGKACGAAATKKTARKRKKALIR